MNAAPLPVRIDRVPLTEADALVLVEELQQEYVLRYGGRDETPLRPEEFEAPVGAFFVASVLEHPGGPATPVASGAWRAQPHLVGPDVLDGRDVAEVKRMYVRKPWRGRGLARRMLAHVEAEIVAAGHDVAILETGLEQPEAIALYLSVGYQPIPGFGHHKDAPLNRCFARRLLG